MVREESYFTMTATISATMAETKTMKRRAPVAHTKVNFVLSFLLLSYLDFFISVSNYMALCEGSTVLATATLCSVMAEVKIIK